MPSYKLFSISENALQMLRTLKSAEKHKPEGLTLANISSSIKDAEKSNLHRSLEKLSEYMLIEKKIYTEHTDVRYAITPRGKAYLEVRNRIKEFKLDKKTKIEKDKIILAEYWAGGSLIDSWKSMEEVIEHWKKAKPIAYGKNFYRFIYANGVQKTVRLQEIETESDITNTYK